MPRDYVSNVIQVCEPQADRIRLIVDQAEIDDVLPYALTFPSSEPHWERLLEQIHKRHQISATEWLHSTPLLGTLRRRLEKG
jgi:hypothetical protein